MAVQRDTRKEKRDLPAVRGRHDVGERREMRQSEEGRAVDGALMQEGREE